MAIKIGANFAYNGKLANFERDSFETKAAMKAFNENNIDEGHLSYCKEDGKTYQYKSANTVDTVTGRWRVFKTDIVVDAALNDTSTNAIQNKAVFDALKLKADAVALGKYQPKYAADYIATEDISTLPITTGVIDLNGNQINLPNIKSPNGYLTIRNGLVVFDTNITELEINSLTFDNVTIACSDDVYVTLDIQKFECINVNAEELARAVFSSQPGSTSKIREFKACNSYIPTNLELIEKCTITNSTCYVTNADDTPILINASNSVILGIAPINIAVESVWSNTCIQSEKYFNAYIDETGTHNMTDYAYELDDIETNAPQTKVVYEALQLKADKTQLDDYLTKTNANTTYATKDSLNNEVNQLVEEINLKLDDTVAASTYLRQDDANTTYAKKSDITNIYKFKGTKTNYSDLPTTGVIAGDVWNITNADAEHGIKAGDNVAWNGTAWDNLSGVTDLSGYATTTTTDAMSADIKKLMDKTFPFTVKVSLDKTLAKKGTSQAVKVTITPKIGDDNTNVDEIMINGAEYHGATPYVHSATATATTTYNVRVRKDTRTAQGSATITFVNPSYDGAVAANFTVTEANIKTLTEAIRSGKGGTRTFNLNNQKACIAYPKAFGAATSIKDANGFDYLASYTRSELNVNGELYYVYLLTNATTITDMKQTVS